jgi:hypothetical protein
MNYSDFNKYLKTFEEKQNRRETERRTDCLLRNRTIKDRQKEREKDRKTEI